MACGRVWGVAPAESTRVDGGGSSRVGGASGLGVGAERESQLRSQGLTPVALGGPVQRYPPYAQPAGDGQRDLAPVGPPRHRGSGWLAPFLKPKWLQPKCNLWYLDVVRKLGKKFNKWVIYPI